MAKEDREMRINAMHDMSRWNEDIDRKNTARLKEIVAAIGWPTIPKVGSGASQCAWLLVQHATKELDFMKHCLDLMKAAAKGDTLPANIALLEDRLLTIDGKPQIYGTQFQTINGVTKPFPIEDFKHVDGRRKQVGLNTFAENEARIMARYK